MSARTRFFHLLGAGLLLMAGCATSQAVTLDWDSVTWTPGSLSNAYDVDASKPGNDITVTLSGNMGQFAPKNGNTIPANLNIIEGGFGGAQKSLVLHVDLANQSQGITVSVNFSAQYTAGVNNVSFTLFDVDFSSGAFQDEIRSIQALSIDGSTLIAPTITTSSCNSVSGVGINQVVTGQSTNADTGATSGNGNVTISFGANAIKSFTFTYGSGATAPADPSTQGISLHDITFTPVPEINPAWSGILTCCAVAGLILRHSAKFRK
ncbi:MAG: hypothetical protein M3N12_06475 [Verrucomicrobiota bacterium]|nr:hypothetical protein [Verrucomicrobiota bacterium]